MASITVEKQKNPIDLTKIVLPLLLVMAALLFAYHQFVTPIGIFPEQWNIGLGEPLDAFKSWVVGNRKTHWLFVFFFDPLSAVIDWFIRRAEWVLVTAPWPVVVLAGFLLGNRAGNLRLGLLSAGCLLLMGLFGLWEDSMATLALMITAVIISLLIGIPLGVYAARNDRAERFMRPVLDAMQTMPAFVYLIPVVLFFGIARVPSVIATIIYAIPPVVRLTNLGIRGVSAESIEAAEAFGSTPRQILTKVQIPQAMSSIMAGVNQTIMMALAIVVIAALIGSGGLGIVVLKALRRQNVGEALEAGLAIVVMAVLLDRLSLAFSKIEYSSVDRFQGFRLFSDKYAGNQFVEAIEKGIGRIYTLFAQLQHNLVGSFAALRRYGYHITSLIFLLIVGLFCAFLNVKLFPESWNLGLATPVDQLVGWMQRNLYYIGGSQWFGTGPFSDFLTIYLLRPLRLLLIDGLAWPTIMLLIAALAYAVSGWRLAVGSFATLFLIGLLGMWEYAMDTLSQVIFAVLLAVLIGVPLGIWSARSDSAERLLKPLMDLLQTIPPFVYLVPVIMLFGIGRVPGIMASVLYALPPTIRLTNLGIREVDAAAVEAAESFGSTPWQALSKVQIPLALPSIMLGINQTVMMVLAMVIIAGLVGAPGLGLEVVEAMLNNKMGASAEVGISIVIMAIIIDRITQAWAEKRRRAANI